MAKVLEGRNRATPEEAGSFVAEVDRLEQDFENRADQIDAEFKKKKRDLRKSVQSDIDAILSEAKKQGVNKGVIRAIVDGQKRIRKHTEQLASAKDKAADGLDNLESDEKTYAVDIVQALGSDFSGFGLGAAAVEKENGGSKPDGTAGIVAAVERDVAAKAKDGAAKH